MANTLWFGDNLHVLQEHVRDESVDLVYLDPPFNSNASYNVFLKTPLGTSDAQVQAFEDTWQWRDESVLSLDDISRRAPTVFSLLQSMRLCLGDSDIMAYLVMMGIRLIELKRVLKKTGSIYLHCDPAASHYLKLLLDAVFERQNFRSEIIWRRTTSHNKTTKQYGPIHDSLLFYSKSDKFTFHPGASPYTKAYVEKEFRYVDAGGRFRVNEIMGPGKRAGQSSAPWRGYDPSAKDRHWAIPGDLKQLLGPAAESLTIIQQLDALNALGYIITSRSGRPKYKQYVGRGIPYQDIWAFQPGTENVLYGVECGIDRDVKWLDSEDERIGFPTQKPVGLLKRIIETSTNPGDVVLDPFCGCGTTIHAAEVLDRQWIGIDITYVSIQIIEDRIKTRLPAAKYRVEGIPKDDFSARALAKRDPYQFQLWAVSRLGGHPRGRGSDKGIDGEIIYKAGARDYGRVIISVKAGESVSPYMVRELAGTVSSNGANMGVFVCLDHPSPDMKSAAASAGVVDLPGGRRPKVQIVTLRELLGRPDIGLSVTLNTIVAAQEARKQPAGPKRRDRRQPEMLLPLPGGKGRKPRPQAEFEFPQAEDASMLEAAEEKSPFDGEPKKRTRKKA